MAKYKGPRDGEGEPAKAERPGLKLTYSGMSTTLDSVLDGNVTLLRGAVLHAPNLTLIGGTYRQEYGAKCYAPLLKERVAIQVQIGRYGIEDRIHVQQSDGEWLCYRDRLRYEKTAALQARKRAVARAIANGEPIEPLPPIPVCTTGNELF